MADEIVQLHGHRPLISPRRSRAVYRSLYLCPMGPSIIHGVLGYLATNVSITGIRVHSPCECKAKFSSRTYRCLHELILFLLFVGRPCYPELQNSLSSPPLQWRHSIL